MPCELLTANERSKEYAQVQLQIVVQHLGLFAFIVHVVQDVGEAIVIRDANEQCGVAAKIVLQATPDHQGCPEEIDIALDILILQNGEPDRVRSRKIIQDRVLGVGTTER